MPLVLLSPMLCSFWKQTYQWPSVIVLELLRLGLLKTMLIVLPYLIIVCIVVTGRLVKVAVFVFIFLIELTVLFSIRA